MSRLRSVLGLHADCMSRLRSVLGLHADCICLVSAFILLFSCYTCYFDSCSLSLRCAGHVVLPTLTRTVFWQDMSVTCKEYYDPEKSMLELVFAPCSPIAVSKLWHEQILRTYRLYTRGLYVYFCIYKLHAHRLHACADDGA